MSLLHDVTTGQGRPPFIFVHGFGCSHTDWAAQMAHLAERYGGDVAEVMRRWLCHPPFLLVKAWGAGWLSRPPCRLPDHSAAVVLVDGSQFAAGMASVLQARFAEPDGYATLTEGLFKDIFTAKSESSVVSSVIELARRLPRPIGEKMLTNQVRYDVGRLASSLVTLHIPVMGVQTIYSNEKRERQTLQEGQTSPIPSF